MGKLGLIVRTDECVCRNDYCVCDDDERMVRARIYKCNIPALTEKERENITRDTDRCGEGSYKREELLGLSDEDLCRACIAAWTDYARGHGLI